MDSSVEKELRSRLEKAFSDYYEVAGGKNYRYKHLESVRKIAVKISERIDEDIDKKVLEIAALYHDIGRVKDIEDGRMDPFEGHEGHDDRGAEIVEEYIGDYVSGRELEKIKDIISGHHSEPESVEGKIVQDADNISNFGVNNLWRQFHYACEHRINMEESLEYFWDTATTDYKAQLRMMNFEVSRAVAEKRLEKQKKAMKAIEEEMAAEDI